MDKTGRGESGATARLFAARRGLAVFCGLGLSLAYVCLLAGCNDISKAPPPEPGPGPLTIVTALLPNGTVNQPYATALGGSGGITPYTWSLAAGSPALPSGLNLDSVTGAITGVPTVVGTTNTVFRLEDESVPPEAVEKALPITITTTPQPLSITTTSLPKGTVNQPYPTTTLQATGGIQPYSWSVNPSLPNGLQFNLLSPGTISGIPLAGSAGTNGYTFTVRDSGIPIQTASRALTLTINATSTPVTITTTSPLPDARVGRSYDQTLQGSGGNLPYSWSVTPALPTGLSLEASTGRISGAPAAGTVSKRNYTFTIRDNATVPQTSSKIIELEVRN